MEEKESVQWDLTETLQADHAGKSTTEKEITELATAVRIQKADSIFVCSILAAMAGDIKTHILVGLLGYWIFTLKKVSCHFCWGAFISL